MTCAFALGACGGSTESDAGNDGRVARVDGGPPVTLCDRDDRCDNGAYCDGAERCLPGTEGAGADGCVAGTSPCAAGETCDEAAEACTNDGCTGGPTMNGDLDGDGDPPTSCGGNDCDDDDSARFQGNSESCSSDAPGHDEDCDPMTYGFRDIDMDGAADATCFNIRDMDGMRFGGTDCDDNNAAISPLAAERCDGTIDEDCDGMVDEECPCTPEGSVRACGSQVGECEGATEACTALGWSTCSEAPGTELCDGSLDEDCDGTVDEGCTCTTGANRPCGLGACAIAQQTCVAGAWDSTGCPSGSAETCNGIDDNCNGTVDDVAGLGDACGSSVGPCNPGVRLCMAGSAAPVCGGPGYVGPTSEVCDHRDQDCDALRDDGVGRATCTGVGTTRAHFGCRGSGCNSGMAVYPGPAAYYLGSSLPTVDWGRRMTVRADWSVYKPGGGVPGAYLGVIVTPVVGAGSGDHPGSALPTVSGDQRAIAVLLNIGLGYLPEIWEMTSTGSIRRARSTTGLPAACLLASGSPGPRRTFRVTLSNVGPTLSARVEGLDGCGSSTVSYSHPDWQRSLYGDSETGPYPRYYVGALGWAYQDLSGSLTNVTVTRSADASGGHCVACPW